METIFEKPLDKQVAENTDHIATLTSWDTEVSSSVTLSSPWTAQATPTIYLYKNKMVYFPSRIYQVSASKSIAAWTETTIATFTDEFKPKSANIILLGFLQKDNDASINEPVTITISRDGKKITLTSRAKSYSLTTSHTIVIPTVYYPSINAPT